jgi:uncharacterized membrane protein YbhN (UPF0104 family)
MTATLSGPAAGTASGVPALDRDHRQAPRRLGGWLRLVSGTAVVAVVLGQLGAGPFLEGLRAVRPAPLAAAAGITVLTTVCAAWRWRLVARGLGSTLPLLPAAAAYYRSQFLNTVLPGGVLGDVHRAVRQGTEVGDVGRGLRAVGWERSAGQAVQLVLTLTVLLTLPSPVPRSVTLAAGGCLVLAVTFSAALARRLPVYGPSRSARFGRAVVGDIRVGLLASHAWPGIVLASTVVVAGHAATFLLAAHAAGVAATTARLVPLAMVVLVAMAVPANVGGWGPREGTAAVLFGAAGLGAHQGVATATVYGVMAFTSSAPGALVLVGAWLLPGLTRRRLRHG